MSRIVVWALNSSALILIFLAMRALLRNRLNMRIRYALWLIVAARLLVPVQMPFRLPFPLPELPLSRWEMGMAESGGSEMDTASIYRIEGEEYPLEENRIFVTAEPEEAETAVPGDLRIPAEDIAQESDAGVTFYRIGPTVPADRGVLAVSGPGSGVRGLLRVLPALWMAGVMLLLAVVGVSNLLFARRLRKVCRPLAVDGFPLPVRVAPHLDSPCLSGILWPTVYLTPEAAADEKVMRHVLAHELTHYLHRDHLWALVRCLCLALHWYNPLVWMAAAISRRDGELACDEGAVALLGEEERIPYGRTLVDMVARRSGFGDLFSCSTAMSAGRSMRQRVETLLRRPRTAMVALMVAVTVLSLCLAGVFAAGGTDEKTFRSFQRDLKRAEQVALEFVGEDRDVRVLTEDQRRAAYAILSQGTVVEDAQVTKSPPCARETGRFCWTADSVVVRIGSADLAGQRTGIGCHEPPTKVGGLRTTEPQLFSGLLLVDQEPQLWCVPLSHSGGSRPTAAT